MFNTSKYTKWYFSLIEKARSAGRKKGKEIYYEAHHITPESLGGPNIKSNLVLLTAREHFICHLLLPKMTIDPRHTGKMAYAFFRFKHKHSNSRLFDRFRTSYGKSVRGEGNQFYGRKHSPETIHRISGKNHHMFGKNHTEESRQLMRSVKQGTNIGPNNPMFGKTHTLEWRQQHSESMLGSKHVNYGKPAFNAGRIWIHNHILSRMIPPSELNNWLTLGWAKGRLPK